MSEHKLRIINNDVKNRAMALVSMIPVIGHTVYEVVIQEADRRTFEQNQKLWPMLSVISKQVEWHGIKLSKEEWKDFFTAGLKGQKVVPNMEGTGFIAVGGSTSRMSKRMFSDLIELIYAFGSERDVEWNEKAIYAYETYMEAA